MDFLFVVVVVVVVVVVALVCLSDISSVCHSLSLILFVFIPFSSEEASSTKRPDKTTSKADFFQRTASESIIPLQYSSSIWHVKNGTTTTTTTTIPSTKSAEIGSTSEGTVQDTKSIPKGTSPTPFKRSDKTVSKSITSQETTFTADNLWLGSVHSSHPIISPFQSTWHTKDGTTRATSRPIAATTIRTTSSVASSGLAAKISPYPTAKTQKTSQTSNAAASPPIKFDIGMTRDVSSVAPSGLLAKISPSPAANTPRTSQSSRSIAHTSIKPSSSEPLVISTRITASADTKKIVSN